MITDKWDEYLERIHKKDKTIYSTEGYCKLYDDKKNKSKCFIYRDGSSFFIFPFLSREVKLLAGYYDFETHYGYGGGITNSSDNDFLTYAWRKLKKELSRNSYIAGFIRFTPMTHNIKNVTAGPKTFFDRHTVAIDLTDSEEEIWLDQIHAKHRNVIRKAQSNGLKFIIDKDYSYFEDFFSLYVSTMKRLDADEFYFFDKFFFTKLRSSLSSNSFLAIVKNENKVISAAIIMYDENYGHYHLSGSDKENIDLYPNNFMLYKTALCLKSMGIKMFHLGGGITSDQSDSLYKFKKRFNKKAALDFHIGKFMINEIKYNEVIEAWKKTRSGNINDNLFLAYRYE